MSDQWVHKYLETLFGQNTGKETSKYSLKNGIAYIPVKGVLTNSDDFSGFEGVTHYDAINENFQRAIKNRSVRAVVLDVDSPGGDVSGCFDLVDTIYQARGSKPIISIVKDRALSAGYAIASAADSIFASKTATIGSIGVVAVHVDMTKMDEEMGLKYSVVYSGKYKASMNPHQSLSEDGKSLLQEEVNEYHNMFVETVSRNRPMMTVEHINKQESATFPGFKSIHNGLIDHVSPYNQSCLSIDRMYGGGIMDAKSFMSMLDESEEKETIVAQLTEPVKAAAKKEAHDAVLSLAEVCALGHISMSDFYGFVKDGLTVEAVKDRIFSTKQNIVTGVISDNAPADFLIKDAQRRVK